MSPFFNFLPAHHIAARARSVPGIMLILMLAASTLISTAFGSAQAALVQPEVTAKVLTSMPNLVFIEGDGFTPGGRVQIVVVDQWGNALHEPVWTMSSSGAPFGDSDTYIGVTGYPISGSIVLVLQLEGTATYGPNGSQDPASGYQANGLLDAGNVIVRVYDETANTWSAIAVSNPDSALASSPGQDDHSAGTRTCTDVLLCQEYS